MRTRLVAVLACIAALFLFASPAMAQEGDGASVVVLKFELFDVPDGTTEAFYKELEGAINAAPDMHVKAGGEVSMKDLLLTVGCEDPTEDCLGGLRDFVDADRIVFGTLQQSEDVTLFTVRMFDFAESRFVRETVDQTVQGSEEDVVAALPAVVEAFVYGDTGVLMVEATGADNAEIFFDGEKVGVVPMKLENLPLGEHAVTVKTRDGLEKTEKVLLRNGQEESVSFAFEGVSGGGGGEVAGDAPSAIPGWIAVGVGVIGAGVGVYGYMMESQANDDLDARCADGNPYGNVCDGPDAQLASAAEKSEFQSIYDSGSTGKTLQLVGFSVAGAGLVVGGILLYRALAGGSETEADAEATASNDSPIQDVTFGVAPTNDGVSAGFGFSF